MKPKKKVIPPNLPTRTRQIREKNPKKQHIHFTKSQIDLPSQLIAIHAKQCLVDFGIAEIYEPEFITKLINNLDLREV